MRLVTLMLAIPALASPAVAHDRCTVPQDQRRPANELRAELKAKLDRRQDRTGGRLLRGSRRGPDRPVGRSPVRSGQLSGNRPGRLSQAARLCWGALQVRDRF